MKNIIFTIILVFDLVAIALCSWALWDDIGQDRYEVTWDWNNASLDKYGTSTE